MTDLTEEKCVPCQGGTPPFTQKQIEEYLPKLKTDWEVIDNKKIKRKFEFKDFKQAMTFVNQVADLAESEKHHPDIFIHYNKVTIKLWTYEIGGLFSNDFILAAKIEKLI